MNKLGYKVSGAVAAAILWGSLLTPAALADTTLEISGNGADSTNTIAVSVSEECKVKQTANTDVLADVTTTASTGGNEASGNTGGSVSITTGDATAVTTITVTGGSNTAINPCCCQGPCPEGNPESSHSGVISDNGAGSANTIAVSKSKSSKVKQKANTAVLAVVKTKAKTGKNKANSNTGPGAVTIDTGIANSTTEVTVAGGTNTLLNP